MGATFALHPVTEQIGFAQLVGHTSEEAWGYCGMLPLLVLIIASVSANYFLPAPGWPLLCLCR